MKKLIFIATLLICWGEVISAKTISIGTNPQGSLAYVTGSAIAKVVIENSDLKMRVVPQGGDSINVPLVNSGELDFSLTSSVAAVFARKGEKIYKKPNKNFRAAAILFPFTTGFIVKNNSDIQTIQDLKGKRIASSFIKQKIVGIYLNAALHAAGVKDSEIKKIPVPNGLRGIEDLEANKLDAAFFALTAARTKQANVAINGGIRILPIENTKEMERKINEKAPGMWISVIEPNSNYPGLKKKQGVFTTPLVLTTSINTPKEVVYEVVKILYNNKKSLITSLGVFRLWNEKQINRDLGLIFHPGAEKFFKEVGL